MTNQLHFWWLSPKTQKFWHFSRNYIHFDIILQQTGRISNQPFFFSLRMQLKQIRTFKTPNKRLTSRTQAETSKRTQQPPSQRPPQTRNHSSSLSQRCSSCSSRRSVCCSLCWTDWILQNVILFQWSLLLILDLFSSHQPTTNWTEMLITLLVSRWISRCNPLPLTRFESILV